MKDTAERPHHIALITINKFVRAVRGMADIPAPIILITYNVALLHSYKYELVIGVIQTCL